jgi:Flp pilus assembly pilin Flp
MHWPGRFFRDETGLSVVEYLIGAAVIAGVAYICRSILVESLRTAHDSMVNNVTSITGN